MFFHELLKGAYLKEEPPLEDEITLLPAGVKAGMDYSLVVNRSLFEQTIVNYRATEPMSEAILMAIGSAKALNDPVWLTLVQNEAVVEKYTTLCNDKYADQLQQLEGQNPQFTPPSYGAYQHTPAEVKPSGSSERFFASMNSGFVPPTPGESGGEQEVPPIDAPQQEAAVASEVPQVDVAAEVPVEPPVKEETVAEESTVPEFVPPAIPEEPAFVPPTITEEPAFVPPVVEEEEEEKPETSGLSALIGEEAPEETPVSKDISFTLPGVEAYGSLDPEPAEDKEEQDARSPSRFMAGMVNPLDMPAFTPPDVPSVHEELGLQEQQEPVRFIPPAPQEDEVEAELFTPPKPAEEPEMFTPPAPAEEPEVCTPPASREEPEACAFPAPIGEPAGFTSPAPVEDEAPEEEENGEVPSLAAVFGIGMASCKEGIAVPEEGGADPISEEEPTIPAEEVDDGQQVERDAKRDAEIARANSVFDDADAIFGQYGFCRICTVAGMNPDGTMQDIVSCSKEAEGRWLDDSIVTSADADAAALEVLRMVRPVLISDIQGYQYELSERVLTTLTKLLYEE